VRRRGAAGADTAAVVHRVSAALGPTVDVGGDRGSNMARAVPLVGHEGPGHQLLQAGGVEMITSASDARYALLGARAVGEETLNRFYVLHCIALPLVAGFLIALHFWRVRKDGSISGPREEEFEEESTEG